MTENNNENTRGGSVSIWPTVWKYALIITAFRVVYNLLLYATGLAATAILGYVGVIVAIVLLVIALKGFRSQNGGFMSFGQGFGIGFVISVIATGVRAIVDSIYLATAGQEFLATQREEIQIQFESNPSMDPQALEMIAAVFDGVFTPGGMFVVAAVTGIFGWIILSLIIALVMKNAPPRTE